ncbi:hypothetical protein DRN67_00730 [Candidatus Micrarchaeota archaeon]|nr:MAG: hypothetical protein DRN67_00730 [Candidatus Micrarchaeota archaeon]
MPVGDDIFISDDHHRKQSDPTHLLHRFANSIETTNMLEFQNLMGRLKAIMAPSDFSEVLAKHLVLVSGSVLQPDKQLSIVSALVKELESMNALTELPLRLALQSTESKMIEHDTAQDTTPLDSMNRANPYSKLYSFLKDKIDSLQPEKQFTEPTPGLFIDALLSKQQSVASWLLETAIKHGSEQEVPLAMQLALSRTILQDGTKISALELAQQNGYTRLAEKINEQRDKAGQLLFDLTAAYGPKNSLLKYMKSHGDNIGAFNLSHVTRYALGVAVRDGVTSNAVVADLVNYMRCDVLKKFITDLLGEHDPRVQQMLEKGDEFKHTDATILIAQAMTELKDSESRIAAVKRILTTPIVIRRRPQATGSNGNKPPQAKLAK